jgi:hypothetical protein
MLTHAQRQRLEPQEQQEGAEGREAGADIAQRLRAQFHQVTVGSERFVERQTVVCR